MSYIVDLLDLQQDGNGAISAPSNWKIPPLLEVETDFDSEIQELCDQITTDQGSNKIGRWHFFVGSPGNGKSAIVGKIYRILEGEKACDFLAETNKGPIPFDELNQGEIPYLIRVHEPSKKYSCCWLAQDTSVVPDPYVENLDPAEELLRLLESAWEKGVSLLVCTNRGVLEKAYRLAGSEAKWNKQPWFKGVKMVIQGSNSPFEMEFEKKGKPVFEKAAFSYTKLDHKSLVIASDTLSRLVNRATSNPFWDNCTDCDVVDYCPFYQNRSWLKEPHGKEVILNLLRKAEALSGQIIVFREASALLSLLLAGCPRDYDNCTPCEWVKSRVSSHDYFTLLGRRIYMVLFSSGCPDGLDADQELNAKQVETLKAILVDSQNASDQTRYALDKFLHGKKISSDVGVERLLGNSGCMSWLDPISRVFTPDFLNTWDGELSSLMEGKHALVSTLEEKCLELWKELEIALEACIKESSVKFSTLRRWISAYLLRLGSLSESENPYPHELDQFLSVVSREGSAIPLQEKRDLEQQLAALLSLGHEEAIPFSKYVSLKGQWARDNLKPRIGFENNHSVVALPVKFGSNKNLVSELSAEAFLWMKKYKDQGLVEESFPMELLHEVYDTQVRAAADSSYSLQNDDVELIVKIEDSKRLLVTRYDGELIVEEVDERG